MNKSLIIMMAAGTIALGACSEGNDEASRQPGPPIEVLSDNMKELRAMSEEDRLIALKRAVFASGKRCQRAEASGYAGRYKNMDQWSVRCGDGREWALFIGADDSVQLRACADVEKVGLPACRYDGAVPGQEAASETKDDGSAA